MKKLYILIVLLLTLGTRAQNIYLTGNIGAGYSLWNPEPFNNFVSTYNGYLNQQGLLRSPMDEFSGSNLGFSRGLGFMYETKKGGMALEYSKVAFSQTRNAFFNDGNGRELKLRFVTWNFNFDFYLKAGKLLDFGGIFGVAMRSGAVYSSYMYGQNRSLGADRDLNGIYRGIVQANINLGLVARINITRFMAIQVRAYRGFDFTSMGGDDYLSAFSDVSPGKNLYAEYFPKDYAVFVQNINSQTYDFEQNVIPNVFNAWYFQGGLIFKLPLNKHKK